MSRRAPANAASPGARTKWDIVLNTDSASRRMSSSMNKRCVISGSFSASRIPRTLWNMVVFVSVVVFGGFLALGVHSLWLSLLMVAAVAGSITFLLSTLKDMDNPFTGVWNVSYVVMTNVASRIG